MNVSSLFRADLTRSSTVEIVGKLVDQFQVQIKTLDQDKSPKVKKQLQKKLSQCT